MSARKISISGLKNHTAKRICMPTARRFSRMAFRSALYEAQDVLCEIENVDMIELQPAGQGFRLKERWARRLLYHDVSRRVIFQNPGLRTVRLDKEYDLFIAVCQNHWDLLYINAINGWKDHCRTSVCWLDELWTADLPASKYWLHALKQFDHVFVGCHDTVVPLSEAIGKHCHWLPNATDMLRFTPYPYPVPRVIDVYSMGRRAEAVHKALLQEANNNKLFYVYDSFPSLADLEPRDYREHRNLYASMIKRSRYVTVAPAKMDAPEETQGQIEVGDRYYEAAAAGAILLGQRPECPAFEQGFPWKDAVVQIDPGGSDVSDVLAHIDPDQLQTISRKNASEALQRHDWAHRWKAILQTADVAPSGKLLEREKHLNTLAATATPD